MSDIKLICFDLDETLVEQRSWYKLNRAMGITHEEDQVFYKLYREGIIPYEQWVDMCLKLYQKRGAANLETISKALSGYEYKAGAKETVRYLKDKGYTVALISGSIDIMVDKVARDLDIELAEAVNVFVFDSKDLLENIVTFGNDSIAKLRHLESFCRKLGIQITECACVGDGDNDKEMFERSAHGVVFADSPLAGSTWKTIDHLIDLQKIF